MRTSYKKNRWKYAGVCGLAFVAILSVFAAVLEYYELERCMQEKSDLVEQLNSYQRMVYVAEEKLPKGTVLTADNVYQEIRISDFPQEKYITEEAIGMALTRDVAEGTAMTVDMLCAAEENVRDVFLSEAEIPDYMQSGDRIDVRIRYANAEDYIVLADKCLVKCESGKGMVLQLTEEEILLLSSAIADDEQYSGTKLYVVRYPEYVYTESGIVTYIANKEILALLGKEKTEGESRNALEERLMQKQ